MQKWPCVRTFPSGSHLEYTILRDASKVTWLSTGTGCKELSRPNDFSAPASLKFPSVAVSGPLWKPISACREWSGRQHKKQWHSLKQAAMPFPEWVLGVPHTAFVSCGDTWNMLIYCHSKVIKTWIGTRTILIALAIYVRRVGISIWSISARSIPY